jgi:hypothetical protein
VVCSIFSQLIFFRVLVIKMSLADLRKELRDARKAVSSRPISKMKKHEVILELEGHKKKPAKEVESESEVEVEIPVMKSKKEIVKKVPVEKKVVEKKEEVKEKKAPAPKKVASKKEEVKVEKVSIKSAPRFRAKKD